MQPSSDLRALTGIRGIIAIWVALSHIALLPAYSAGFGERLQTGFLYAPLQFVFASVDILLVISGFFLYRNYRDYLTPGTRGWKMDKFYLSRVLRLLPVHLLTIAVIGLYHWLGIAHPTASGNEHVLMQFWPLTLLLNVTLMNAWGFVPGASWNEPAWTLSALFFTYLIFPAWIGLVNRCHTAARQWFAVAAFLLLLEIVPRLMPGLSMADGLGCLLRTFCLFMAGCFAYRLYERGCLNNIHSDLVCFSCVALLYAGMMAFIYIGPFPLILLHVLYVPLVLSLAASRGFMRRVLVCRVCLWLGMVSYSYYLLHYPVLLLIKHWFGAWYAHLPDSQTLLWMHAVGLLAVIALLSWVCYRLVEVPAARFARRRLKLREP